LSSRMESLVAVALYEGIRLKLQREQQEEQQQQGGRNPSAALANRNHQTSLVLKEGLFVVIAALLAKVLVKRSGHVAKGAVLHAHMVCKSALMFASKPVGLALRWVFACYPVSLLPLCWCESAVK